jgi:hypothetical protein
MDTPPLVTLEVTFWQPSSGWPYFLVAKCPFCKKGHVHTADPREGCNPREHEGLRTSICGLGEYILHWDGRSI